MSIPKSRVASGFGGGEQLPGASSELVQNLFPIDVAESFVYRHLSLLIRLRRQEIATALNGN